MANFNGQTVAVPTSNDVLFATFGDYKAQQLAVGSSTATIGGPSPIPVNFRRFDQGLETPG